ncbi:MAG: hypothetical protein IPN45_10380 [Actinomycetales bacterium]|nr:hypothetical protein [Actinomycetales bacterium]
MARSRSGAFTAAGERIADSRHTLPIGSSRDHTLAHSIPGTVAFLVNGYRIGGAYGGSTPRISPGIVNGYRIGGAYGGSTPRISPGIVNGYRIGGAYGGSTPRISPGIVNGYRMGEV